MPTRSCRSIGALVEGPACYPWLDRQAEPGADRRRRAARRSLDAPRPGSRSRLERVGLTAAQDKKYKAYSLGMRQRLGLASALLRPRQMLILDEPTNGMDPQGTREIRHLIRELAADGTTVFLSSHLLAEIEQVCTHVAMMSLGRLITQGSLAALQDANASTLEVDTDDIQLAVDILARRRGRRGRGRRLRVRADSATVDPRTSPARWSPAASALRGFTIRPPVPRGHVRRAHRGGLRCCSLSSSTCSAAAASTPCSSCSRSCRSRSWSRSKLSGGPDRGEGPTFLNQVTNNGVFAALAALVITLPVFLPLAVSIVAGDSIAGETGLGTMRYLLIRPAGRTRLLAVEGGDDRRVLLRGDPRGRRRRARSSGRSCSRSAG